MTEAKEGKLKMTERKREEEAEGDTVRGGISGEENE